MRDCRAPESMAEAAPMPLKTLIVDDEPLAVERLQILCARIPGVQLVGTASEGEAAIRLVDALEPELIFLDISMPGMSGMEVAERLGRRAVPPSVVFVTAFEEFAIAAFDLSAADYLLKPVAPDRLERAVRRAELRQRAPEPPAETPRATAHVTEFWVPSRGELVRVAADSIERVEAERDYMRLFANGRSYLIHETIGALEQRMDPALFMRVHRSAIIRRDRIARLGHDGQGNWTAELDDGTPVRIGRTYLASVRAAIAR